MPLLTPRLLHDGSDDLPVPTAPILEAVLSDASLDGVRIVISPHLCSATEVDEFVNQLIDDAEQFRREAKHALDIAQSRNRSPR